MEKRLKNYISYLENLNFETMTLIEQKKLCKDALIQIGFFQHERLVHLIVTVTFSILMLLSVLGSYQYPGIPFFLLSCLFFVLLVPYIRHYYILENGVQKLYQLYDKMDITAE